MVQALDQEKNDTVAICNYCSKDTDVANMVEKAALRSHIKGKMNVEMSPSGQCIKSLMPPVLASPLIIQKISLSGVWSFQQSIAPSDHFENQFVWSLDFPVVDYNPSDHIENQFAWSLEFLIVSYDLKSYWKLVRLDVGFTSSKLARLIIENQLVWILCLILLLLCLSHY